VEKKTRQQEGNADLASLLTNINTAVAQNTRRNYAYDNLDLPSLANNLAVTALIINQDQGHKNYFLYRDSEGTRQWQILPWDCDLTFGHTWTGSTAATTTAAPTIGANYFDDHIDSQRGLQLGAVNWIKTLLYSQPEFNKMYLRRLRTLMDEWLVSETATAGYFETRFAAVMDTMDPPTMPVNQTDLWLDGQKWGAWWPTLPWKITAGNTSATVASNAANFATVWNLHGPRPSLGRIINPNGNPTTNLIADTTNNAANSFYISSESYTQGAATVNTAGGTNASLVYPDKTYPPFGGTSTSNGASPPTFTLTGSPRTAHPFLKGRRLRLFDTSATRLTSSGAVIPLSQPALPNIQIQSVAYNPGSMGGLKQDAEYFVVKNHETTEIDISGWTITGGITYTFPGGCVIPPADPGSALPNPENIGLLHVAKSPYHFRQRSVSPKGAENRLVVGPYDGQLSARGETLELRTKAGALVHSTAWAADPTAAQAALRVVEILYAPSAPTEAELAINPALQASDFEFIVLENISGSPLVLDGATFTEGVSFTFGTLTLNPGQRVHLVANLAAFAMRRPAFAGTVAGPYVGDLDNGGEQLHLKDAAGESVLEFAYDGAWYWPADENGHSLVIVDKNAPYTTWDAEQSWAPSLNLGGVIGNEPAGMIYKQFRRAEFTAPEQIDESLSGPEADLDADGSTNLIEYSASGQPDSPHSNRLPTVGLVVVSGENYATLTFRRNKSALDLVFNPEAGSDLDGYSPMLAHGASVDNLDGTESVTFRDSMIYRSENRRFMRLRVELVPEP
jgi:hypothetical protein